MDPFEDCLRKGRLKQIDADPAKVAEELTTALDELERARSRFAEANWSEAATQGYFATYRAARAAVCARGYRDTNLYGLCAALQRLYVDTDELPPTVIDHLREAKDVKDVVYEGRRGSRHDAQPVLERGIDFVRAVVRLLAIEGFDADAIDPTLPEVRERRRGPDRPRGRDER